jgi:hypothetical protein
MSLQIKDYCVRLSYCCALVYEYGVTVCRVATGEEVPTIKEVAPLLYSQMASVSCVYHRYDKLSHMSLSQLPAGCRTSRRAATRTRRSST